jgi:hypothetical protein
VRSGCQPGRGEQKLARRPCALSGLLPYHAHYWPFMIGICQGQTELSSPLPLPEVFVNSHSRQPVPSAAVMGVYVFSCSSLFGFEFLQRLGSTAKRDQSFICAYPAFREGLHGSLSLGNANPRR